MRKRTRPKDLVYIAVFFGLYFLHDLLAENLGYQINKGMSFGINLEAVQNWLMMLVLAINLYVFRGKLGMSVLASAALVNIADRIRFGGVRDYWNFMGLWVNNINDWIIGVGIVILLIEIWKENTR